MPLRVAYHGPSTTFLIRQSILGRPYAGLWLSTESVASHHFIISWQSSQTEFIDSP